MTDSELNALYEDVARDITRASGVDPEHPCPGVGRRIPLGETWPAWRVRLPEAKAAVDRIMARLEKSETPGEPSET